MSSAVTVPSGSGPAIQFKDVRIGFDEGDIFRGVSFRVEPRETMILLGETGTGKTLTLKLAAGLLAPSEGVVRVLGQEVSNMEEKDLLDFRRKVGFVFQEGALFDSMTVAENVAYRLREDRVNEEEIEPRVLEVLGFDRAGVDQPAADCPLRFPNGGTRSDNFADDHYADPAAAGCVRGDGAARDPSIAGRFCAGKFSFRCGSQACGGKRA